MLNLSFANLGSVKQKLMKNKPSIDGATVSRVP